MIDTAFSKTFDLFWSNPCPWRSHMTEESIDGALSAFKTQSRRLLVRAIGSPGFAGVLDESTVRQALEVEQTGADELARALLPAARLFAHASISGYRVGAVCTGASGALYLGANLEAAGLDIAFTLHAEQSAIAAACLHGERDIATLALTVVPCGYCRQFLFELSCVESLTIIADGHPPMKLSRLLPLPFGTQFGNRGTLLSHADSSTGPIEDTNPERLAELLVARSYAPYTKAPSAVVIETNDNRRFGGVYIESAALNPSCPPVLAAWDRFRFAQNPGEVVRAFLAEKQSSTNSHGAWTEAILRILAPSCSFSMSSVEDESSPRSPPRS